MSHNQSNYDIFIAYSLSPYSNSSEAIKQSNYLKALEIYHYLTKLGYSPYFLQPDDPTTDYTKTPLIASTCKLFLFVANRDIIQKCSSGCLTKDLCVYNELTGFMSQKKINNKNELAKTFVQVYTEDNKLSDEKINNLHLVFQGINPIRTYANLQNWVKGQLPANSTKNSIKTGWDEEVANFWETIYAPARPSNSEIEFYRKFFKYKINRTSLEPKALILGSTESLIQLAIEECFVVYVVDKNENYCNAILKKFGSSKKSINTINCDWACMDLHETLKDIKFDIIIGDMSLGNIDAQKLERTIVAISNLLKDKGLWLGKSIFRSTSIANRDEIELNVRNYYKNKTNPSEEEVFAATVYDIAMQSCLEKSVANNSIEWYKMDFKRLSIIAQEIYDNISKKDETDYSALKTAFNNFKYLKQKNLSFYIYRIKDVIAMAKRNNIILNDTGFGTDTYSLDFPLLVFEKKQNIAEDIINDFEIDKLRKSVNTFFPSNQNKKFAQDWTKHIPSQYYLVKLSKLVDMEQDPQWKQTCNSIKEDIISEIKIDINNDLLCYIKKLSDEKMDTEVENINNITALNESQQQQMKETYKLAVLLYLSTTLAGKQNKKKKAALCNLVINKLFATPFYDPACECWSPSEALWLTAKVCIAARDTFASSTQNQELITATETIINNYDTYTHNWNCTVGSNLDTSSLCIETILCYYNKLSKEFKNKAKKIFKDILNAFVLDDNIYETIVLHPIGEYAVSNLITFEVNELYPKKVLGRVAFISSLLRIINFFDENEPQLPNGYEYSLLLLKQISNFWRNFKDLDEKTLENINDIDICTVPQILYFLSQALDSGKQLISNASRKQHSNIKGVSI